MNNLARAGLAILTVSVVGLVYYGFFHTTTVLYVPPQECPEHAIAIRFEVLTIRGGDIVDSRSKTITTLPGIEATAAIPEYHDCQKVIINNSYAQQMGIWPVDNLAAEHAALIVNYGDYYDDLNLQRGFSCLLLQRQGSNWKAAIIAFGGPDAPNCANESFPGPDKNLSVEDYQFPPEDIPSVAKWDREPDDERRYYIGIRCGDDWCEIGPKGFKRSKERKRDEEKWVMPVQMGGQVPAFDQKKLLRISTIRGWYDEQELAIESGNGLVPSVRGLALPHPSLGDWGGANQADPDNPWVPVAYLVLDGRYDPMALDSGGNIVSLCQGDETKCGIVGQDIRCPTAPPITNPWYARFWSQKTNAVTYSCVHQKEHVGPIGAVRWHWDAMDEKLWVRCQAGCCQVN